MSISKYCNNISCKCRILIEVIIKICKKYISLRKMKIQNVKRKTRFNKYICIIILCII